MKKEYDFSNAKRGAILAAEGPLTTTALRRILREELAQHG